MKTPRTGPSSSSLLADGHFSMLWKWSSEQIEEISTADIESFVDKKRMECMQDLELFAWKVKEIYDAKQQFERHEEIWDEYHAIRQKYTEVFPFEGDFPSLPDIQKAVSSLPPWSESKDMFSGFNEILSNSRYVNGMKTSRKEDYDILTRRILPDMSNSEWQVKMNTHYIPIMRSNAMSLNTGVPDSNVYRMKDLKEYLEYQKSFVAQELSFITWVLKDKDETDNPYKLRRFRTSRQAIVEIILALKILTDIATTYNDEENVASIHGCLQDVLHSLEELDSLKSLVPNLVEDIEDRTNTGLMSTIQ